MINFLLENLRFVPHGSVISLCFNFGLYLIKGFIQIPIQIALEKSFKPQIVDDLKQKQNK